MGRIWKNNPNLEAVNKWCINTAVDNSGIEVIEIGDDFIKASMPVDQRTVQPQRRLHGGASCLLAESIGSIAANLVLDNKEEVAFGIAIDAHHLRPAIEGTKVYGKAAPLHLGSSTHVWEIKIYDEKEKLVCNSKLTMAVVKR